MKHEPLSEKTSKQSSAQKLIIRFLLLSALIALFLINPNFSFLDSETTAHHLNGVLKYMLSISLWLVSASFINQLIVLLLWERNDNKKIPRLLKNILAILVYIIAIAGVISFVFQKTLTGFWATSSVFALILGFALRDMIVDMFTGLAVNIDQPYKIGDWIMVHKGSADQNIFGEVLDINWRTTRIQTETNTLVLIPNSLLTTFAVTNYSRPTIPTRMETTISLEPEVPVTDAKRIILAGVKNLSDEPGFVAGKEPEILLEKLSDCGYDYKIRYWIRPWTGIAPTVAHNMVLTSVLNHLELAGIFPAFPKTIVFHSAFEKTKNYKKDHKGVLEMVPLFKPLLDEEFDALAQVVDPVEFLPGLNIITENEEGTSMFVITEGLVDVFLKKGNREIKVARLAPGQFFGEMSLFTGAPRSASIKTVTKVKALEIKKEHLSDILANRPKIAEELSNMVTRYKLENESNLQLAPAEKTDKQLNEEHRLMKKIRSFFKLPNN
ncbi:MAG: mechanosensitive ion channel family protein [Candidatus Marinimicrobia bacterium]|nr:mechanosensitive ion channel family protein [Candidatus Neomarinimicrobiota bacterium]